MPKLAQTVSASGLEDKMNGAVMNSSAAGCRRSRDLDIAARKPAETVAGLSSRIVRVEVDDKRLGRISIDTSCSDRTQGFKQRSELFLTVTTASSHVALSASESSSFTLGSRP